MGKLLASGNHVVPVLMQQMATYFAKFRLVASGAYQALVQALGRSGKVHAIQFASLNYECVLEIALSAAGVRINYSPGVAVDSQTSSVWKVHGSCNFLPGPEIQATRAVSYGSAAFFNTSIRPVDPSQVAPYCTGDTSLFPAMAHFAEGKTVQIGQPVIQAIQNAFTEAVIAAKTVAIVGVFPNVLDSHVWDPLGRTNAEVIFIGNAGAFSEWVTVHRGRRPSHYLGSRFEASIDALSARL
jgi:hypothetical protein